MMRASLVLVIAGIGAMLVDIAAGQLFGPAVMLDPRAAFFVGGFVAIIDAIERNRP